MVVKPQYEFVGDFNEGYAMVVKGNKAGFIDQTGQVVIEPQFDQALSFADGLAAVQQNGLWGFIDPSGQMVINPQFTQVNSGSAGQQPVFFGAGLAPVSDQNGCLVTLIKAASGSSNRSSPGPRYSKRGWLLSR